MSHALRRIAPGYAALNARLEGAARGERWGIADRCVVREVRVVEGAPIPHGGRAPSWQVVRFEPASGSAFEIGFQIVASPRGEPPALPLRAGDEVDLAAELEWHFAVVARAPGGGVELAAGLFFRDRERSFAGVAAQAGALAQAVASTWSHHLHLAFDDVSIDVPYDGWYRLADREGGALDVSGVFLHAEPPSAQATHLRFAILRAR